jgi:thiol-disulfide isomerase/thioredoxin
MPIAIQTCRWFLSAASLALASAALAAAIPGDDAPATPPAAKDGPEGKRAPGPNEAKFFEKLDKADRDALQANVGWLLPKPPESLTWVGGEAMVRDDFRGKVTVIQSVGGKPSARTALEKVKKSLPEGVELIGVHTPDQAERADDALKTNAPCPVAIDSTGEWCDALGVWKKPVNIVVDKTGSVRFVGLTEAGLKAKLPALLSEEVDESVEGREKPKAMGAVDEKPAETVKWPEFLAPVQSATDMRGKKVPDFNVEKWLTARPDPGSRLVAVDFWATWCGPCVASIPHVNELSEKFGQDILFVGVSDEKEPAFNSGMKKAKLKPASFKYSLALDSSGKFKSFFGIKGIPHMAIFSSDGIVRWQGHPAALQEQDLEKLVAANRANSPAAAGGAKGGRGWAGAVKSGQKSR